jgi:hypothetical protein
MEFFFSNAPTEERPGKIEGGDICIKFQLFLIYNEYVYSATKQ